MLNYRYFQRYRTLPCWVVGVRGANCHIKSRAHLTFRQAAYNLHRAAEINGETRNDVEDFQIFAETFNAPVEPNTQFPQTIILPSPPSSEQSSR